MHAAEPLGGDGNPAAERREVRMRGERVGVFEKIFGKRGPAAAQKAGQTFKLLEGYTPVFHNLKILKMLENI